MRESLESSSTEPVLPTVDKDVLDVMHVSNILDPKDKDRLLHSLVEEDQPFALEIVHEGYIRSDGDPKAQYAFIEGAIFSIEALRRTQMLKQAEKSLSPNLKDSPEKPEKKPRFTLFRQTVALFTLHSLHKASRGHSV